MGQFRSPRRRHKVSPSLVALSSSAILAVYAAGYVQTRSIDDRRDFDTIARLASATPQADRSVAPVAPIARPTPPPLSAPSPYRDGTFAGAGRGPHGMVDVEVVVAGGLIVSAQITDCGTRYPCDRIAPLEQQVVELQDLLHLTWVTGATDSSGAYMRAVSDALVKALK